MISWLPGGQQEGLMVAASSTTGSEAGVIRMKRIRISVKSYEGYKKAERPVEFSLGDRDYGVQEILDQWYEPDSTYFKVKASDGNIYILKHSLDEEWTLESFRREDVH